MVCEELQRTRRKVSIAAGSPLANSNGKALAAAASAWGPASSSDLGPQIEGYDQAVNPEVLVQGFDQDPSSLPTVPASPHMLERVDQYKKNAEASVILSALKTTRWNRRNAANLLKIDYTA
jgi:DNA-binding NtrC family response regulator